MKHLSWLVTLPITLVVVVFAVSNRESVALDLWPFRLEAQLPLFLLVLGCLLVGFLIGAGVMWWSSGAQRQRARAARREVTALERKIRQLERAQGRNPSATAAAPSETAGSALPVPAAQSGRGPQRPAA